MKLKICIILTILLSASFGYSQPKLITREELDERQVTKFVDKFTKSFFETKDFEAMPSKFFAEKFKLNMVESNDFLGEQLKELSFDEQFEYTLLVRKLVYFSIRNTLNLEIRGLPTDKYSDYLSFPPDVLEMLKKNNFLVEVLDLKIEKETDEEDENEDEEITSSDIVQAIELMRNAVALFKIYDKNQGTFSEETVKMLSELDESSYEAGKCGNSGKCFGMSDKTRIYWKTSFPLCFHLVRENGELKVFYIDINIGD